MGILFKRVVYQLIYRRIGVRPNFMGFLLLNNLLLLLNILFFFLDELVPPCLTEPLQMLAYPLNVVHVGSYALDGEDIINIVYAGYQG